MPKLKGLNQTCHDTNYASGNSEKTCIVSSNTWVNSESANWKLDYYKYKGCTFAEVLKRKIKRSAGTTKLGSNQDVTLSKSSGKHTELNKGKMANQYSRTSNEVRKVPTNRTKPGKDFSTNPVTCYNRYAVFHQGDGVILEITDTEVVDSNLEQNLDDKTEQIVSSVNPDNNSKGRHMTHLLN